MSGNDWIPVNCKLPENSGLYLVQRIKDTGNRKYPVIEISLFSNTEDVDNYKFVDKELLIEMKEVVAWQPLPEFWEDPDIPKKGDYGIFDGEQWVKVGPMFTPIPKPSFNDKSHISEYQKDILRNIYNDLLDFAEEVDNDFAGVWTVDNVIVRLNDYISRIKEVSDNQGE